MRFSIITITLNDLSGLQKTVESILAQTFRDIQLIIVDGASTDGTTRWLRDQTDDRIEWISERDKGLYDAMNKGLERATGEYIVFMNGGDEFADRTVLERVADVARSGKQPDFIFGDAIDVTHSGKRLYKEARPSSLLWRGMFTQHQSMFFARNTVGAMRYRLEYRLAADYDFIARFLKKSASEAKVGFAICRFQLGGRSDTGRLRALREDFIIRRRTMGLGVFVCCWLWGAHLVHFLLKRAAPSLTRNVRYRKEEAESTPR